MRYYDRLTGLANFTQPENLSECEIKPAANNGSKRVYLFHRPTGWISRQMERTEAERLINSAEGEVAQETPEEGGLIDGDQRKATAKDPLHWSQSHTCEFIHYAFCKKGVWERTQIQGEVRYMPESGSYQAHSYTTGNGRAGIGTIEGGKAWVQEQQEKYRLNELELAERRFWNLDIASGELTITHRSIPGLDGDYHNLLAIDTWGIHFLLDENLDHAAIDRDDYKWMSTPPHLREPGPNDMPLRYPDYKPPMPAWRELDSEERKIEENRLILHQRVKKLGKDQAKTLDDGIEM